MATAASDIVDAIDAAVLAISTGALETQVLGRRVRRENVSQLLKAREYYARVAADESDATGGIGLLEFGEPV